MTLRTPARRLAVRGGAATALVALAGLTQTAASAAPAQSWLAAGPAGGQAVNPYSPAYQHPYRHGAVPTRSALARMRQWAAQHPAVSGSADAPGPASPANLGYGGAIDGIGVTTGQEKVYLVFYGSQWGAAGADGNGNVTLAGDTDGEAPYLQNLLKGLGTNNELWSGVMTQYCDLTAVNSQTCSDTNPHVAYPSGGALAGVWVDESTSSPSQATAAQLGTEAVNAASHFGNTTKAKNRSAQYVILSPTGTHPDGFNTPSGQFCAWHDWNGDSYVGVSSPYGDIAFTNSPYVTDMGASCGQNFVNSGSAGALDGVSIVEGHEYAETITDQNPAGGWTDHTGYENGDKCAWISPGSSGGAFDLSLTTGSFAMQTTWSNTDATCMTSDPVVTTTPTQLLQNPGFEAGVLTPWSATSGVLKKNTSTHPSHSGNWLARLDGRSTVPHTDRLSQKVAIPITWGQAAFSFWLEIKSNDPTGTRYDRLKVQVLNSSGKVLKTLHTYSNRNTRGKYIQHTFSLSSYLGRTIILRFVGRQTLAGHKTSFLVDDTALNVS